MSLTVYVCLTVVLLGVKLLYLRMARYIGIVDTPNSRSLHTDRTIVRGGGVLFWVAALLAFWYSNFTFPLAFAGLTLVSFVSFLDDLRSLSYRYRLGGQCVGVGVLIYETGVFPNEIWVIIAALIVGVGILNAYNFMDGINGMMALYSLITVGTLWYWPVLPGFSTPDGRSLHTVLLPFTFVALLIFSCFNVRRRAVCFAGDVGSMSVAFIILYALLTVIHQSQTYLPVLLLAVYGVDSVLTISQRLWRREDIFQAHRQHLFQLLVHRLGWPHLRVSAIYAGVQAGINGLVLVAINWSTTSQFAVAACVLTCLAVGYLTLRWRLRVGECYVFSLFQSLMVNDLTQNRNQALRNYCRVALRQAQGDNLTQLRC